MDNLKMNRRQRIILHICLLFVGFLVIFLSRLAFQAAELDSFDAVNYALAIKDFDMRLHQPQPPGYILYILVGKFLYLFLDDAKHSLLMISALFSGLAVLAIYGLAREFSGERAGWLAAGILATSPEFWFFGEISSPYTMDLFFSVLLGWVFYLVKFKRPNFAWLGAVCLGLAGAFRPQTMVFFFPLFLYSIWSIPLKMKVGLFGLSQVVFLSFFIPSVNASGGFHSFFQLMTNQIPIFSSVNNLVRSTVLRRFIYNMIVLAKGTLYTVGEFVWFPVVCGFYWVWKHPFHAKKEKIIFIGLMILPIWVVYLLIWAGNPGTFLVSLPPFILLAAIGLNWFISRFGNKTIGWSAFFALLIFQTVLFLLLPERPFGMHYRAFDNRQKVVRLVGNYQDKLALVQQFPPESTLVLAADFRHLQYYLPQYPVLVTTNLSQNSEDGTISVVYITDGKTTYKERIRLEDLIPVPIKFLILFDGAPDQLIADPSLVEAISLNETSLYVVKNSTGKSITWSSKKMEIHP